MLICRLLCQFHFCLRGLSVVASVALKVFCLCSRSQCSKKINIVILPLHCKAQSGIQPLSDLKSHALWVISERLCVALTYVLAHIWCMCVWNKRGALSLAIVLSLPRMQAAPAGQRFWAWFQFWRLPTGSSPTVRTGAWSGPVPAQWRRSQCNERHSPNVSGRSLKIISQ